MTWLTNWNYRKPITISNTGSSLTDYQVLITIDTASFTTAVPAKMRSDCGDIRFTSSDGSTPLNYWIESDCNTASTKIWVKIPSITTGSNTIYIYYDNASVTSLSSYFNTFDVLGDGSSGPLTISSANTIVNNYTYLTGNENAGDNIIAVNSGTGFSNGDEILIIQMQNYSGGTAGQYEFRKILSGGGTTSFALDTPLKGSYTSGTFNSTNATVTQIVRIPQYTNVTINSGASITASAWDGYKGGIVIFKASGTVNMIGSINVTGKGFRTGISDLVDAPSYPGESYTSRPTSRSTLRNLGGGGGVNKIYGYGGDGAGGGGYGTVGADGENAPSLSPSGNPGQGGTTYGTTNLSTIFLGSGGGSANVTSYGDGGGIIIIYSSTINNTGGVMATGTNATATISEGGSGGGAGGSIYLVANTIDTNNNVNAVGGTGDKIRYDSYDGYGGNGGSGRIRISANSITGTSNPIAYTTGFDTEHSRKYSSPEPTFSIAGTEEPGITATNMSLNTNVCAGSCQIIATVTWQNLGNSSITFRPTIIIDGITYVQAASDTTIVGPYPATSSPIQITTPTLLVGTHAICPYPN